MTSVFLRGSEFGSRSSLADAGSPLLPGVDVGGHLRVCLFPLRCVSVGQIERARFSGVKVKRMSVILRAPLRPEVEGWVVSPAEERSELPSELVAYNFSFAIIDPLHQYESSHRGGGGKGG